jgi:DNA-binding MarR family transcriptional regulator
MNLTSSQMSALLWLRNRSGDGLFDRSGVLVAAGERAGVMRSTWNKLCDAGLVEKYMGRKRLRVTEAGQEIDLSSVDESETASEMDDL